MEIKVCKNCGKPSTWDSYFQKWICLSCANVYEVIEHLDMIDLTPEEKEIYNKAIRNMMKPLGINIKDL